MVSLYKFAKDIKIKKIYGSEAKLIYWLENNSTVFILDIEQLSSEEGFIIYYML